MAFIAPKTPHFGGLGELGVKSFKNVLQKTILNSLLKQPKSIKPQHKINHFFVIGFELFQSFDIRAFKDQQPNCC